MKTILKIVTFIILGLGLAIIIGEKLDLKSESSERVIKPYFENNIKAEVLTLGSSHVLYGVNPEIIEKELDLKAYNLAHTGQKIEQSYFLLKESISNNQIPKIVVLDIFGVFLESEAYDYNGFSKTYNYLKKDNIKKEYLESSGFELSKLKILDTHTNWKFMDRKNFKNSLFYEDKFSVRKLYNGYFYESDSNISDVEVEKLKDMSQNRAYIIREELSTKELDYIVKIKKLCIENNVDLIAIKIPVINYYLDGEKYSLLNKKIESFMKNQNISYIDYNLKANWEKIELDYLKDFLDNGHLNQNGAKKLTDDLKNILGG